MKSKISTRTLCHIAILIALTFVLERYVPPISLPVFRISFAFVPMMCCGMLFGPVWGAAAYGIADILGWPVMGQTPVPLILVSRIVEGFIFGLFLHSKKAKFAPHAILSAIMTQTICAGVLTTIGLSQLWGTPYFELLVSRLWQLAVIFTLQLTFYPALVRFRSSLLKSGVVPG